MGLHILRLFDIYNYIVSDPSRHRYFNFTNVNRSRSDKSSVELTGAQTSRVTSNTMWGWSLDILDDFMLNVLTANNRKQNNDFISCVSAF